MARTGSWLRLRRAIDEGDLRLLRDVDRAYLLKAVGNLIDTLKDAPEGATDYAFPERITRALLLDGEQARR